MPPRPRRHWQRSTSWTQLGFVDLPDGSRVSSVRVGEEDDPDSPLLLMMRFPPNGRVPVHSHETDYAEVVLEGTQYVGRRLHHAGDVRVVKAGTAYGPLVAGPEGATVLVIFRDSRWRGQSTHSSDAEELRRDILGRFIDRPHEA
jgi:quercetin dioxygenase-like cupin family protein